MKRVYFIIIFFFTMILLPCSYAITPEQIIELKKAGVSAEHQGAVAEPVEPAQQHSIVILFAAHQVI